MCDVRHSHGLTTDKIFEGKEKQNIRLDGGG